MDKDRSITNSDEDMNEMRMKTHCLNRHFDLSVLGESMRDYPRRVLELIRLVEAQRDLLRAVASSARDVIAVARADVERMRPVFEAAVAWRADKFYFRDSSVNDVLLRAAIDTAIND